tara:strand:+ start:210765 stop:210968 length:204 start_codon:yes stop_codon:yes gene_type:complete
MADQSTTENNTSRAMTRRKALTRLGLAAGIAYAAPTIVHLDRSANAKVLPSPCPPPGKGGKSKKGCK